jgi:hypothetical protein
VPPGPIQQLRDLTRRGKQLLAGEARLLAIDVPLLSICLILSRISQERGNLQQRILTLRYRC